jgi:hypothetical protein
MAVYRPSYRDPKSGKTLKSKVWWYHFTFAGRHIQESSKSTRKTIAVEAEKRRRLELERGFNAVEDKRQDRIRTVGEMADAYMFEYRLRHPRSTTFAEYAIGHIKRLAGSLMSIDVSDGTLREYQTARLQEKAAPKSINEETGFFLRLLGEPGDLIRAKMCRQKTLKLKTGKQVAKAFTPDQKAAMLCESERTAVPEHLSGADFGAQLWSEECRTPRFAVGSSKPQKGSSGGGCEQNGSWGRPNHSVEHGGGLSTHGTCGMVSRQVRRIAAGMVCIPVWKTSTDGSDEADDDI